MFIIFHLDIDVFIGTVIDLVDITGVITLKSKECETLGSHPMFPLLQYFLKILKCWVSKSICMVALSQMRDHPQNMTSPAIILVVNNVIPILILIPILIGQSTQHDIQRTATIYHMGEGD